jgi:hypothetical protein
MLKHFLASSIEVLKAHGRNLSGTSELLNALHLAALKPFGVARIVPVSSKALVLAMSAVHQPSSSKTRFFCTKVTERTIELATPKITAKKLSAASDELIERLSEFALLGDGAYVWNIPDGYMAALSASEEKWAREGGGYFSHESLCVQNTGAFETRCTLYVFFEPAGHDVLMHDFTVGPRRSIHLRLDKIPGVGSRPFVPKSTPVGYKIVSREAPVIVQGSRILTSGQGSEFASFGTTMAWAPA